MNKFSKAFTALFIIAAATLSSCLGEGDDTIILESGNNTGIPSDNLADENPIIDNSTTNIPNIQYTVERQGSDAVVRIDMTGIQDADSYDWLRLLGTGQSGQNVWLSIDGQPKGISVYNNADDNDEEHLLAADLVFLVDNSGSMSEEADAIARDIVSWTEKLAESRLDVRFGCVGYGGYVGAQYSYLINNYGITGALDLSTQSNISDYLLNRSFGTNRTFGYAGENAAELETYSKATNYSKAGGECGVQALRFADEHFNFRPGANRIYINFTDDANYPGGDDAISTDYVRDYWTTSKGTIHTVLSNDSSIVNRRLSIGEKPWLLSRYTGGTELYVNSSFSGVTLESLPVTGAMTNSYVIRFTNIGEFMDGKPHLVKITILSEDGKTRAERSFYITFTVEEN